MKNLKDIIAFFEKGKTPKYEEFKASWESFWHKSEKIEQTAILGLNEALNNKVSHDEIKDLQAGILFQDVEVDTPNDLPIPPSKLPNGDVPEHLWGVYVKSEGYYYQYNAETKKWSKTPYVEMPKDVATIPETNKIIQNLYSKFDIYTDEYGNVLRYNTARDGIIEIYNNLYCNSLLEVDAEGWVVQGTDRKNRQLLSLEMEIIIPSIFNVVCDELGNVYNYHKIWSTPNSDTWNVPNRLSQCFSPEAAIVRGAAHYGFPGICAGKGGVLHAFYRKAKYHTGVDGSVMYCYSKNGGNTWSDEAIALQGEEELEGYFSDWRDSKVIRMSNGKFMLSQTKGYAKLNGGQPPYHVDYDAHKYEVYAAIYSQIAGGILDISNPQMVKLPLPENVEYIFGAGGLIEHNNVIYYTVYGNKPNSIFLFRSLDYGETWEFVSKIVDEHNENCIAFMGDTMYCVARAQDNSVNASVFKSNDFGLTWDYVKSFDTYFNGMYAQSLGDTIMIAGRAYNSRTNIVFMDKNGDFMFNPIAFGGQNDSSYADICTFENYVHVIYYSQLSNTEWGIFTRKIERNKVLGLSY